MRDRKLSRGARLFHVPCRDGKVHRIILGRTGKLFIEADHCVDAELTLAHMAHYRVSTCALAMARMRGWIALGLLQSCFPPRLRREFMRAHKVRQSRRIAMGGKPTECDAQYELAVMSWDADDWKLRKKVRYEPQGDNSYRLVYNPGVYRWDFRTGKFLKGLEIR